MQIFFLLLGKILPFYAIILLGFIAGKFTRINSESIAVLLVYIVNPIIIFNGVVKADLSLQVISLPILFFAISIIICMVFYYLSSKLWTGAEKNIVAYSSGNGNVGYFGLPVALALFGPQVMPLVVMMIFGVTLYDATLGYYMVARGHFTVKESIVRVLKFPVVHAFVLGIVFNLLGAKIGQNFAVILNYFQGTYAVLGMLVIGLGTALNSNLEIDYKFIGITFIAKFLVWPIIVGALILLDNAFFHIYSPVIHNIMLLVAIVPLAANTVAYAMVLKLKPEKAAVAVLLSTFFALLYIPLVMSFCYS